MDITDNKQPNPIKVSLPGILGILGVMLVVGFLGGLLAQQLLPAPAPLPLSDDLPLRTIEQQVTISPNTAAAKVLEKNERSIVLLGPVSQPDKPIATGFFVTNDGVLVTTHVTPNQPMQAYDAEGAIIPLSFIGRDVVYGLSFFRAGSGIFPSLDISQSDPLVGTQLLGISRSADSLVSRVIDYRIREYQVPGDQPIGVDYIFVSTILEDQYLNGSPLIDDNGKVGALLLNAPTGTALPVSFLQASLSRLANNQWEHNLWQEIGLDVDYTFSRNSSTEPLRFTAVIMGIVPQSKAAIAGLKTGDSITTINQKPLAWLTPTVSLLQAEQNTFGIERKGELLTISVGQ